MIPTNSIDVQDISKEKNISINEIKKYNFTILLGDFYFLKSAQSLKLRLENEGNIDNLLIKRLSQNNYRLQAGPFLTFNSLKDVFYTLNTLGFDDLTIYNN